MLESINPECNLHILFTVSLKRTSAELTNVTQRLQKEKPDIPPKVLEKIARELLSYLADHTPLYKNQPIQVLTTYLIGKI
jgi:molecular chaperone GrpE (heat shock protein)